MLVKQDKIAVTDGDVTVAIGILSALAETHDVLL